MKFAIKEYSCGWRRCLTIEHNSTIIDGHANSLVSMTALQDGVVTITLKLSDGGLDNALTFINKYPIKVGESKTTQVKAGDSFTLECVAPDKFKCWYKWVVSPCEFIPSLGSRPFSFLQHGKLGDTISIMVGLENYAVANELEFIEVGGHLLYKQLLSLFDFKHVKFSEAANPLVIDDVFIQGSWEVPWLSRFMQSFYARFGGVYIESSNIPRYVGKIPKKENFIACQLDSRASGCNSHEKMLEILRNHDSAKVIVLGGPDTDKYLGDEFEYRLGTVDFIADQLLRCKYLVAGDSGVAHLAGLLNVKSYVYPGPGVSVHAVKHFFSSYPRTVVYDPTPANRVITKTDNRISTNLVGRTCTIDGKPCVINTVYLVGSEPRLIAEEADGSLINVDLFKVKLNG